MKYYLFLTGEYNRGTNGMWFKYFSFFWRQHTACGILVPQLGIKPSPPAVEVQSLRGFFFFNVFIWYKFHKSVKLNKFPINPLLYKPSKKKLRPCFLHLCIMYISHTSLCACVCLCIHVTNVLNVSSILIFHA